MTRPDIVLVGEDDGPFHRESIIGRSWEDLARRLGLMGSGFRPPHAPLLSLASLGAWLRREGFGVSVHDNVFGIPDARAAFFAALDAGPMAVGISTTFLQEASSVERLAGWARERCPQALLVLGGWSAGRHEALRKLADATVLGQGQKTLTGLLRRLKEGAPWRGLDGLCWRDNGREVRSGPGQTVEPDELPEADWGLLEPHASLCFPIQGSIGCRRRCAFCSVPDRGRQRLRPIPKVLGELRRAFERHGARLFRFADSNLTSWPERTEEFCRALEGSGLPIEWSGDVRVDDFLRRPSLAAAMRGAGCRWVSLGLESGSDRILAAMRKGFTRRDIISGMRLIKEAGLKTHGHFIVGFPGETAATVDETIELVDLCRPDTVRFNPLSVTDGPDVPLSTEREAFGLRGSWQDWSHGTMDSAGAAAEARRCCDAVLDRMEGVALGIEVFVANHLKGGGLSEEEAMDYLAGMRAYLRSRRAGGEGAVAPSLEALSAKLRAFWSSRGWRPG